MNSLIEPARIDLIAKLTAKGGYGTSKGAKRNAYIQFLKEYKGVPKPHGSYKEHKKKYSLRSKKGCALMDIGGDLMDYGGAVMDIGGRGSKEGASKNIYVQYLQEYKGVPKSERPSYQEYKQSYKEFLAPSKPSKPSKSRKSELPALEIAPADPTELLRKSKKKKAVRIHQAPKSEIPALEIAPEEKAPKPKGKRALNPKLVMFNKCLARFRRDNPSIPYREAQKIVKQNINYSTGMCNPTRETSTAPVGLAQLGLGRRRR